MLPQRSDFKIIEFYVSGKKYEFKIEQTDEQGRNSIFRKKRFLNNCSKQPD